MPESKRIAGVVGPTIVAMIASEFLLAQALIYDSQIPSVIYLVAVFLFVDGLALVWVHNRWFLAVWCG